MSWEKRFSKPIPVPKGKPLRTLRDAGNYIDNLPKAIKVQAEWQTATQALLLVVEHNGPAMFAEIGIRAALNRDRPPDPPRGKKPARKYSVIS